MNKKKSTQNTPSYDENVQHDFIRNIIKNDLNSNDLNSVITRFPPEPNGYLHIGHAKAICLNFSIAKEFSGQCHLRFDDTNPSKEEQIFIDAIEEDVKWLGFDWGENLFYTSNYFDQLYSWAEYLINKDMAYVDDLTADQIREYRGTLTEPGKNSPFRERPITENLALFREMKEGKFKNGEKVLRAKINMASSNINLRDPVIYRIIHAEHPRTGDKWCIYPNYDFAHGQSDAIEKITHSICTLEFEDHRPLYDWFIKNLPVPSEPHQYEFARLNLTYTVLSKRTLKQLVTEKYVTGWDDPRMPTISGYRRRGYPAEAIRDFTDRIGVSKSNATVEVQSLEACVREALNKTAVRHMAVLKPLKVIITNYPDNKIEELEAKNNPNDENAGTRKIKFAREIFIEESDFLETPPKKFFRLAPGREVRLRYAYLITCTKIIKNQKNEITEIHCTYDPKTRGGNTPDGRKVKGTIHWVTAATGINAEIRQYDHLFTTEVPGKSGNLFDDINPNSLTKISDCKLEPALQNIPIGETIQFERLGYYCMDKDSSLKQLIFNQTIGLRDTWEKKKGD